jgi:phospholipid transport system substrate-binding protein
VPIDFAFRKTDLGWKAFDITIEGISYVMTYRNQISPLVMSEGIDKVTADLREGNISLEE